MQIGDIYCSFSDKIPITLNVFPCGELRSDRETDDELVMDGGWN